MGWWGAVGVRAGCGRKVYGDLTTGQLGCFLITSVAGDVCGGSIDVVHGNPKTWEATVMVLSVSVLHV